MKTQTLLPDEVIMKNMALNGILISMAIVISYFERLIPIGMFIPLPGIKLGLANIITLFALFRINFKSAFYITLIRCVVISILFGSLTSLAFSLTGGILALIIMTFLKTGYNKVFSILGISIAGAAAHNTGQIFAAAVILKSTAVFAYLPILLFSSLLTGTLTAVAAVSIFNHLDKIGFNREHTGSIDIKETVEKANCLEVKY